MLVGASAMDPESGPASAPRCSAGAIAVLGSWLPPAIRVVFASEAPPDGGAMSSRSEPDNGGANTVAGSGTDTSSAPGFTSVPAHGVAPTGTPSLAVGSYGTSRRSGTASTGSGADA